MATFYDMCNMPFEMTQDYVCYRNRLLDANSIVNFHTKGKRLLINSYRQNTSYPTMLVMFPNKETALLAFEKMKDIFYNRKQHKITHSLTVIEPIPSPSPSVEEQPTVPVKEDVPTTKTMDLFLINGIGVLFVAMLYLVYRM
jgi:hypothetical protein